MGSPATKLSAGIAIRRIAALVFLVVVLGGGALWLGGALLDAVRGGPRGAEEYRGVGQVAFQGPDGNIYTIHPDGSELQPVTEDADPLTEENSQFYTWPTWSPDGRQLAFIVTRSSGRQVKHALINLRLDDHQQMEAFSSSDSRPFYLYWSPDGRYISFLTEEDADIALRLARAGSPVARQVERGSPVYFDWAPDSSALLVHVNGSRLEVANVDGNLEMLSDQPGLFSTPAWSPNGRHFLYAIPEGDGRNALILAPASGQPEGAKHLLRFQGSIAFQWAPSGDRVAYIVTNDPDLGTFGPLWVLQVESQERTQLTSDNPVAFFWSPDGRKIAYIVPELTGTRTDPLAQARVGLRLALWVVEVGSGERRWLAAFVPSREMLDMLPSFDQYARSVSFWSPDSRQFLFAGSGEVGGVGIWVVDSESGQRRQIATGPFGVWSSQ